MNPNRTIYGRITINGDRKSLGKTMSLNPMLHRIAETYELTKYNGEDATILIELSYKEIPRFESLLSREQQLEQESLALIADPSDEVFESGSGVTAARAAEAFMSPEAKEYAFLCEPQNRIGVPISHIEQIRETYKSTFPDVFPYFPVWRNS